jgi:hypothetical protein
MTIKFFKPSDPRLFKDKHEEWIRENFKVDSIEQLDGDPSAYFVLKFKEAFDKKTKEFRIVVKHKNFFREHFANYNDALAVINKVKDVNYGK